MIEIYEVGGENKAKEPDVQSGNELLSVDKHNRAEEFPKWSLRIP